MYHTDTYNLSHVCLQFSMHNLGLMELLLEAPKYACIYLKCKLDPDLHVDLFSFLCTCIRIASAASASVCVSNTGGRPTL